MLLRIVIWKALNSNKDRKNPGEYAFSDCKRLEKYGFYMRMEQIHRILQTICCRGVHMSMLCMYTAGRVMKAGQKTMVFPIKLPISTICPVITAITKVYLGGVPYGQYSAVYNGQQIKPAVKLYYSGKEVSAADYSVAYSNNVNAGNQATIQIVGEKCLLWKNGSEIYHKAIFLNIKLQNQ